MDIILDGVTISGVSKEVCYDKNYSGYPIIKPQDAIDTVLKYKDFNDKVLKYGLFKKNEWQYKGLKKSFLFILIYFIIISSN